MMTNKNNKPNTTRVIALASTVITDPNSGERIKIRMGSEFDCPNDNVDGLLKMEGIQLIGEMPADPVEPVTPEENGGGAGGGDDGGGGAGEGEGKTDPEPHTPAAFNQWVEDGGKGGAEAFAQTEEGRQDFNDWLDAGNEGDIAAYVASLLPQQGKGQHHKPPVK